jgi:predicted transcriptional regulator
MTVKELSLNEKIKPVVMPNGDREIKGGYVGDLLSWVMGRAREDDAWITIMSNINILAVASLADVSCIILAEGVSADEETVKTANEKKINILSSDLNSYELATLVEKLI